MSGKVRGIDFQMNWIIYPDTMIPYASQILGYKNAPLGILPIE